jgi:hypothetical protein
MLNPMMMMRAERLPWEVKRSMCVLLDIRRAMLWIFTAGHAAFAGNMDIVVKIFTGQWLHFIIIFSYRPCLLSFDLKFS